MVSDLLLYYVSRTLCTIEHVHFLHVSLVLPRLYCTEQGQSSLTRHPSASLVLRLPFTFGNESLGTSSRLRRRGRTGRGHAHPGRPTPRRSAKILMNFELFTSQFQTDYTCNSTRPDCDLAFALASLRARNARRSCLWALPHFMHCWKDGWCRFKEFRKYLLRKFVAMHLPHSVKRHHVEYGSNNA